MPRTLARLRYRNPLKPVRFNFIKDRAEIDSKVTKYVERQSQPTPLKLQTVVNAKAKRQPTGVDVPEPWKPFTLRDVVDPKKKAKHGEIIYVFRSTRTNQILYSLQELLDDHHLEQLPFIGKHSKPPVLRPDEWQPHCVVTFPNAHQGHSAFRRLREFRKLHEFNWDKTNPEYKRLQVKSRIRKIMDQRANFSADLAEILRSQEAYGIKTKQEREELDRQAKEFLEKRWQEIDQMATAAKRKEKITDNIKLLEGQIRSMNVKLRMRHHQNEADQKSLKTTKESLETRLRRVRFAVRKAEQLHDTHATLTARAEPANVEGAEMKLEQMRSQAEELERAIENPDPTDTIQDTAVDREFLVKLNADINALEQAFEAKKQLEPDQDPVRLSILPRYFTSKTRSPVYTLSGVQVAWADLQDALYAKGQWPDSIEHQVVNHNDARGKVSLLSKDEYDIEVQNEASSILEALEEKQRIAEEEAERARQAEKERKEQERKEARERYLAEGAAARAKFNLERQRQRDLAQ
ncbi:hypothetical protein IAQ61_007468 [Plenodomus lingam]|uniref:Large ribosomal subunit protein mL67 n=1 Tax=Leptosphaeria maculans (strain JN3 / isolate v23.1.3 / race Av1-4-5-6-7-8) TaxID=985895 RepID=E5A5M4_LEPMJ|nr:hypothetical protein LEMA_P081610.1 [Plenodomus lingam JN3]KAH9866879.1 hypothetical protein IAQ61_007468 [Plenodomus lingam]CBX98922.1 hypothetical protein LEMA_P081610.1 [Plenodomus lingam JN3]